MKSLPVEAKILVCAVIAIGAILMAVTAPFSSEQPLLFGVIMVLSTLTSIYKVTLPLPRSTSTMSVSYAVDFASLLLLGTSQTMLIAGVSALCQCTCRIKERNPAHRTLFSIASLVITVYSAGLAFTMLGGSPGQLDSWSDMTPVAAAAATYFLVNTGLVAAAIGLSTQAPVGKVWDENFLLSAPGYFVGAAVATGGAALLQLSSQWLLPLGVAPLYLTYRSYKIYLGRIQGEQLNVKEVADLHLATIEALAVAIDAKDQTPPWHIRRVQLYAGALARAMYMPDQEVQGVKTAALLHDIGKLAVPEHILSKRGSLTPEEFQKIRAHPKTGADIISAVPFPYPVAPLILSHHERWDGKGYPSGLAGEDIPLGGRILAVVDCFDALVAERPYHKAMSFDAAVSLLQQEAGKAFDPVLVEKFVELLPSLQEQVATLERPVASPAADLEVPSAVPEPVKKNVFDDIALAHREIYALYEIAQAMGTSLGLADTMELIAGKLSNLVPLSSAALFLHDEESDSLRCVFATGVDADVIQLLTVRSGEGLTGWVGRNRRTLVNARPSADFDAAGVDARTSLQSALVCPLMFNDKFIGTLAAYHVDPANYRDDHRRLMERVSEQAAAVINNSMLFERTQKESLTDALTGLPNTRSMVMHLTRELARAERLNSDVALMLVDLDNFKSINDTHGHHVGDRALCEIARTLRTAIRPYDTCVRYAGDEFIVLLSGCGAEEADGKRQELQRLIDELFFEVRPGKRVPLGISVGAAVFPHDGESYETLLATADSRMYKDKASRKRRGFRESGSSATAAPVQPPALSEIEIKRAAAGIL